MNKRSEFIRVGSIVLLSSKLYILSIKRNEDHTDLMRNVKTGIENIKHHRIKINKSPQMKDEMMKKKNNKTIIS